jgi:MFS superfamily sulfate permease-like transporter
MDVAMEKRGESFSGVLLILRWYARQDQHYAPIPNVGCRAPFWAHSHEIQGMALQSYLFFGSANRLYEHVKELLGRRPECRFLLFDFRLVTGIDSSATHSFSQIKQAATDCVEPRSRPRKMRSSSHRGAPGPCGM